MRHDEDYDESYRRNPAVFGDAPGPMLRDRVALLNQALPVLDLGAGQGRHTLHLARAGLGADAVDPSAVAVETIRKAAAAEGLDVRVTAGSFNTFEPARAPYGAILLFGLVQILTWEELAELRQRVDTWTAPGSLLFITAFSASDAACERHRQTWQQIGPNSFADQRGQRREVRTYLEEGQVLDLFPSFEAIHHWEGLGPEHRHGEEPPERHMRIEAVLKRS